MAEITARLTLNSGYVESFNEAVDHLRGLSALTLAIKAIQKTINASLTELVEKEKNVSDGKQLKYTNDEEVEDDEEDTDEDITEPKKQRVG